MVSTLRTGLLVGSSIAVFVLGGEYLWDEKTKECEAEPARALSFSSRHGIDQVFMEDDGYKVTVRDDDTGLIREVNLDRPPYLTWERKLPKNFAEERNFPSLKKLDYSPGVVVLKDLVPGSQAFFHSLTYQNRGGLFCKKVNMEHYEIHLPTDGKIDSGYSKGVSLENNAAPFFLIQ